MTFSIATFNALDFFDASVPHAIEGIEDLAPLDDVRHARLVDNAARKMDAMRSAVRRMDADVIAWQEVKNAQVLDALREGLPPRAGVRGGGYGPAVVATPNDRGIACGLTSRFPIRAWRQIAPAAIDFPRFATGDPIAFENRLQLRRAALEAEIALPDGSIVVVFVVHFKSMLPTPRLDGDGRPEPLEDHATLIESFARSGVVRMAEALCIRREIDARFDRDPACQLVVAGDFNDTEDSSVATIVAGSRRFGVSRPSVHDGVRTPIAGWRALAGRGLYPCARGVPHASRFTSMFLGVPAQIDHVLVSESLWSRFRGVRILNEMLAEDVAAGRGYRGESDHAPVVTTFE